MSIGTSSSGPPPTVQLSIIIVSYNVRALLIECLESLVRFGQGLSYEVIVIDNQSKDDSCEAVKREFPRFRLMESGENLGFGRANNLAAEEARGEYLLFLNPDTVLLEKETLPAMIALLGQNPSAGIAGCQLLNSNGTLQASYGYFPTLPRVLADNLLSFFRYFKSLKGRSIEEEKRNRAEVKEVDFVKGAFMLFSSKLFRQLGGFDKDFFMYSEERDICYRAQKAGFRVLFHPNHRLIHHGEQSGGPLNLKLHKQLFKSQMLFLKKHSTPFNGLMVKTVIRLGFLFRMFLWEILSRLYRRKGEYRKRADLFRELVKMK